MYASINLDEQRNNNITSKTPFQHQIEAFTALSKTFKFAGEKPGSGILVLPTGAGKTLTAVKWLSEYVIPKNIKILWLAPSFYLLRQAFDTFHNNSVDIPESKKTLNIRCVSSSPSHAKASSIELTDDIVIMTIQTAISNLHTDALDINGNKYKTAFRKFIDFSKGTGLFVVVDEAHHAPAYGCRNLLIGEKDSALGLRGLVPELSLLGLTATPTHNDKSISGWLWKIFENKIIYQAQKEALILQGILAKPKYIEVSTGHKRAVNDELYNRLVKQHQDLPEYIIDELATNQDRNNIIVKTYLTNKEAYGKTIIFADRWFQCVYIKEKLLEKGIKADAIYSRIDADPGSAEARNKRTQKDNERIMKEFTEGKLDVLINVRMLTEGADVPNVKTVFLTRQTTSSILMTQMIGRALRGEKVGGSREANVVLFFDEWERLVDWVTRPEGDFTDGGKSYVKGFYPLEYISIRLIEELSKSIESGGEYQLEYKKICPVGWYKTEIVYADSENNYDSMEAFTEFVMVYEHTKAKFESFINFILYTNILDEWAKEYLDDNWMQSQAEQWIVKYFNRESDDIGHKLKSDLIKIVRHISQEPNQYAPPYYSFEERDIYDLDKIAETVIKLKLDVQAKHQYLSTEFSKPDSLLKTFYKTLRRFETAVDSAIINIIYHSNTPTAITPPVPTPVERELSEEEKESIKKRDGYTCLCCGVNSKLAKLQIDHIKPFSMGGITSVVNSQTLCEICNRCKKQNEIDFRINMTQLSVPKKFDLSFPYQGHTATRTITRIVNLFYHCKAVKKVDWEVLTYTYHIYLYPGNNPEWLLQHKTELLKFIQNKLRRHAHHVQVTTTNKI
ncbi:DEAD/DEAH box helicase [Nostoc sp. FACHB-190]|uniref:DEAD/DEAH box helicase n=1 Tax=Nostoc sp. FACHB-190 TaxID=2692838 RepID=UPI0016888769|nr:DEAD/DEAH box helicase [Nostoc sp. FACHB-190]MBD2297196.1 DEAD/DEAH box helicase family protein [Nostoc sp. FACHB-190]